MRLNLITGIMVFGTWATLLLPPIPGMADDPRIVGTPNLDAADNTIRVKVGQPPWVMLSVQDAVDGSVQTWSGPIGEGQVGLATPNGVGVSTVFAGEFRFQCILQIPKDGLDELKVIESTVVIEGTGPNPTPQPQPVPVEDFPTRLSKAVAAKPQSAGELSRVAATYSTVADQVKGGLLTTPQQVNGLTDALTSLMPSWADIKSGVVDPHLKTLTLKTAADYEPVWRQIAAAVKAGLTDLPPPDVTPLPVSSLHVLIVEEMDERHKLPASQAKIFSSTTLRKWFSDNNVQWRVFDKDVPQEQLEQKWKDALSRPRQSLPWILVSNGSKGWEGPLPKTEAEVITLLEKYK